MSNAKVISMIADANEKLVRDFEQVIARMATELAGYRRDIRVLQQAIAPMAADLDRMRAIVERLDRERGTPPA